MKLYFIFLLLLDWILSNAIKRFPILGENEYETLITGADSFTPDGRLIINESAEVRLIIREKNFKKNNNII
jgi:glycine/D-amino acid oxidase-like deaminating enzyme